LLSDAISSGVSGDSKSVEQYVEGKNLSLGIAEVLKGYISVHSKPLTAFTDAGRFIQAAQGNVVRN